MTGQPNARMTGASCDTCGEPLLFVENVASGKRLPLVRTPLTVPRDQVRPGMVVVSPSGVKGKVLTLRDIEEWSEWLAEAVAGGRLHMTHFVDCRDRQRWQGTSRAARRASARGV